MLQELVVEPIAPVVLPTSVVFSMTTAEFSDKYKPTLLDAHSIWPPSSIIILSIVLGMIKSVERIISTGDLIVKVPVQLLVLI